LDGEFAEALSRDISHAAPCVFLLYAGDANAGSPERFGLPEYSYHIVMKAFRHVLKRFGTVRVIIDPEKEVDATYLECRKRGESCFFLSFGPPHLMTLGLRCPTVPVIAWEYGTIPNETWNDDPRNDWRYGLRAAGKAIMLSHFAAKSVRAAMGVQFPVIALPAPVYDRFAGATSARAKKDVATLTIDGFVWDSRVKSFSAGMEIPAPPPLPEKRQLVSLRHAVPIGAEILPKLESQGFVMEPESVVVANGAPVTKALRVHDVPAKTVGQRIDITLHLALNWYREAVRDLIPPPFPWLIWRFGSWAYQTWQWLRGVGRWEGRPSLYRRLEATKWFALQFYREAVADALPPKVGAKFTRVVDRLDLATRRHPAQAPEQIPEMAAELADVALPPLPAPVLASSSPYPDELGEADAVAPPVSAECEPPLPEPVLAASSPYPDGPTEPEEPARGASVDMARDRAWRLAIGGVVFAAVFSPRDGRKNWQDLLTAFCTTFSTRSDATLVFKMIGRDTAYWWPGFHDIISRLPKFACRVVVLHGHLEGAQYRKLIEASHYVVNTSLAEGLCLPLVEFMSAGRPAIAPCHTAMSDYIEAGNALVLKSGEEYCAWPHDPRNRLESSRQRIEWPSICEALEEAYHLVVEDRASYDAMSLKAAQRMRAFCSDAIIARNLASFLGLGEEALIAAGFARVGGGSV
jgi:glycosyltransferase involved in cell wall biosynthesis